MPTSCIDPCCVTLVPALVQNIHVAFHLETEDELFCVVGIVTHRLKEFVPIPSKDFVLRKIATNKDLVSTGAVFEVVDSMALHRLLTTERPGPKVFINLPQLYLYLRLGSIPAKSQNLSS